MSVIPSKRFQRSDYLTNSGFFTWSNSGHVGVHNNSKKNSCGNSIMMQNMSDILPYLVVLSRELNLQLS